MHIAVISDTHLPRGRREIPAAALDRLRAADVIVHAGDLMRVEVLDALEQLGPRLVGVHGNADDDEVRARLPASTEITADAVTIAIVHNGGPADGRLRRLAKRFPGADAVVFGHSHIPLHETDPQTGFQIFNPGSATDRRRMPTHTMGEARIRDGAVGFALIDLGP